MVPVSYNSVSALPRGACESPSQVVLPCPSSASLFVNNSSRSSRRTKLGVGGVRENMVSNLRTNNFLRHVESMKDLPSGAGHISQLNAVVLGEALATEESDFVFPSKEFSSQALVQSPGQVRPSFIDLY